MKIAMIGQKGIPAKHGGVERHVEELSRRLVERGHEVCVFTRPNYTDPNLRVHAGIQLRSIPSIPTKHLDAITHSALCSLSSRPFDVVHYHAIGPTLTSPFARLLGRPVVATIHGQDWRRAKWSKGASAVLRFAERTALRVPEKTICVSQSLTDRYNASGIGGEVVYVPNGVSIEEESPEQELRFIRSLGLEPGKFVLFAGRIVPEKGLQYLLGAYRGLNMDLPLVVAGGASGSDDFVNRLRDDAPKSAMFVGYRYGTELAALFRHAGLFVLPSDLEGLPIVLLEATAYGTPVLASDIPPNREVLGNDGLYFAAGDVEDLRRVLSEALGSLGDAKRAALSQAPEVRRRYDWNAVTDSTLQVYESLRIP